MEPRTSRPMTSATLLVLFSWTVLVVMAGCADSATAPPIDDVDPPTDTLPPIDELPVSNLTRDDLVASGEVVETEDGFTVDGALTVSTSDASTITFADADLTVRYDDQGRVRSISGKAEIPSPHDHIDFENPIRADLGFFPGRWLNENRDLGIVLRDDTDYFVFDLEARLQMNIATGETGEDAVRPVSVQAPSGGRALMVMDVNDPMYYVYGDINGLEKLGMGWSQNQRIRFRPTHPVAALPDLGSFDATNIRRGPLPIFKIVQVSGVAMDNMYTEVHMSTEDPLSAELRAGYRMGHEGEAELDLGIKDMVGISVPLASSSTGVFGEVDTEGGFRGHYYSEGRTSEDLSWWPQFIPVKPANSLESHNHVTSEGSFQVALEGTYGWEFPGGERTMTGVFDLSNEGMLLEGRVVSEDIEYALGGRVTKAATRVYFQPPNKLLDELASDVNDDVLPRIEDAEAAWNDVQDATEDYEFELSLRGLREDIPPMIDEGRARLAAGVSSAIAQQDGKVWEADFRKKIQAADNVYYEQLTKLRNAATNATDNQTTRTVLERELRAMAARKIFTFTYSYKVLGVTVYSTTVTRRILSDTQSNRLIQAADNVDRIEETSDRKVRMEQVYETVNERELFEDVRDDLRDGLLQMATIQELGFVFVHDAPAFALYARIDGQVHQAGTISTLTLGELLLGLPDAMIQALRSN